MDSYEWNKIVGAILGTLLFVVAIKIGSEMLFEVPEPAKPGYIVPGVTETPAPGAATTQAAAEALPDFGTVLPKADIAHGQQVSQRCQQCHDLSKGGPDKIGPNLWGIVGRARASRASFSYSSAMMADHNPWTFEKLFVYLKLPAAMVPGTKMSFAGIESAQDRIDLIAYLRTLSDSPVAIPPPAPPKAAAATPPAGAAAAPAGQTAAPAASGPDFATALPAADVAAGKQASQQCEQCHDLSKGGPNKIGPNLWDIVNRPRASHPGFSYSSAMSASHDPWTYDKLFTYLESPQTMVPGTKMSFAGIKSSQQRINLLAYLRTLADTPAPLPAASKSAAPGKGT
jgi:cytochrome c